MEPRTQPATAADADAWSGPEYDPNTEPQAPGGGRRFRVTPVGVILVVALVGSLLFLAFALTVRDTSQIPLLASGAAVLGIVFVALAAAAARSTYRAATDGRNGPALGLAIAGGGAAVIGFVCLALAIVLALLWGR
jgi:hypothetical protein